MELEAVGGGTVVIGGGARVWGGGISSVKDVLRGGPGGGPGVRGTGMLGPTPHDRAAPTDTGGLEEVEARDSTRLGGRGFPESAAARLRLCPVGVGVGVLVVSVSGKGMVF